MCIQLIPVMNIGDIIILISTIIYIIFTYRAHAQMRKNMDIPRIKELLQSIIIPIINNLKNRIEHIDNGLAHYDKSCRLIEDEYGSRLIFIEIKRRYPYILKDIKNLDSASSILKENYDELCRVINVEIKDETIKKIKDYNEKADIQIYEHSSEKYIISEIKNWFPRYVMGLKIHSGIIEEYWDEHGIQIIKCADTDEIRELKTSIEEEVNEMRNLINNLKAKLEKERDSIMREYGIPEVMVEIPISRL